LTAPTIGHPPGPPITLCGSLSLHAVTLGAAMHEAAYAALDLPFRYVPFEIEEDGLGAAIAAMRALSIRGLGISMPFKQAVVPMLDAIDPTAARIGAVNTVVNDGGRLTGHNTDFIGAARALAEAIDLSGARVLVLGAGGAARAVAFGLREHGASVTLCNRDEARAAALAADLGCDHRPWNDRHDTRGFDAIVNATSIGMQDVAEGSPLDARALTPPLVVMDIVYRPLATELVDAARRAGLVALHGGRMLLHQAARQHELYTSTPAPLDAMNTALEREIAR
jgi:shikimate dehydrogenase